MACYIVSYDLRNDRDYKALYEALEEYGTWARITESTWAVVTDESAEEIRDYLLEVMDADDRLLVVKSGVSAAWSNVRASSKWLRKHL